MADNESNVFDRIDEKFKNAAKSTEHIRSNFSDIKQFAFDAAATFTGLESAQFFENFKSMAADLVKIQNSFYRMQVNLGSVNKNTQNLKKDMNDIQQSLGASRQDANKLVSALAQDRYVGNLKEAAEATYQIGRATGLGATAFEEATVELSKGAQMSETAIKATYATILKTQQTYGLSDKAMKNLSGSIGKLASNWKAFGASDQQIIKMTAETTKFAAAMDKVGISAEESFRKIEKLTNPDNVEDNIKAYAMMGVDIGQAITTGMVDQGQLQAGMMNMANQISGMGALVGNRFSKELGLGISYTEATKMSRADMDGATQEVGKDNAAAELNKLTELTKSGNEKTADQLNIIKAKIENLPVGILFVLGSIIPIFSLIWGGIKANSDALVILQTLNLKKNFVNLLAGSSGALFINIAKSLPIIGTLLGINTATQGANTIALSTIAVPLLIIVGVILVLIAAILLCKKFFGKKQDENSAALNANTKSNERKKSTVTLNNDGTMHETAMNTSSGEHISGGATNKTSTSSSTTVYNNNGASEVKKMGTEFQRALSKTISEAIEPVVKTMESGFYSKNSLFK